MRQTVNSVKGTFKISGMRRVYATALPAHGEIWSNKTAPLNVSLFREANIGIYLKHVTSLSTQRDKREKAHERASKRRRSKEHQFGTSVLCHGVAPQPYNPSLQGFTENRHRTEKTADYARWRLPRN